ncbi:MAG: MFS transporter [Anaerolineae bacterium]|nr:MFS transporter [Anaerolineae bacterium]
MSGSIFANIRYRFWRPAPTALDGNIRLLYVELVFSAILGGVASFNSAFAVRLGASEAMIGLLSSMPPLMAALVSIPAARMLERRSDRRPLMFGSLFLVRVGYLAVALIPLLFPTNTATALVTWLILLSVPGTIFNAGWIPLLAELLPERRRAFVFSRRSIINGVIVAAVTFLAGSWLEAVTFPYNYQLLYAFGVIAALLSCYVLEFLVIPPSEVILERRERRRNLALSSASWQVVRERVLKNRGFLAMTTNTFLYNFGVWMSLPLFVLIYVRELGASDAWIGTHAALGSVGTVVGYFVWERVIRHKGFKWVLLRTMPLSPFYPFVVALVPDLTVILSAHWLIGFINSGTDLSHFNVLLKVCPRERRASYFGFYSTLMNVSAFIAPMLAVALAEHVGLRATMFMAASVRLVGGLMFHVIKFEEPPEEAWTPINGETAPDAQGAGADNPQDNP